MPIYAIVSINCDESLSATAQRISRHLCGDIEFGEEDEFLKDEIPALRSLKSFAGLEIVIFGDNGRFDIELHHAQFEPREVEFPFVDASKWFAWLISQIPGIEISR